MSNQVRRVHSAENERLRIHELLSMDVMDTRQEERFDRYTRLVAEIFDVPVALISLVDTHRQWFKSRVGVEKEETPREHSICAHAIADKYLEVPDLLADPRFRDNPGVTGPPYYRFYAGAVLFGLMGQPLGTLCLLHFEPRSLSSMQKQWLMAFARLVQEEMAHSAELKQTKTRLQEIMLRDPLTGLPNEPLFLEILENLIHHERHGHQSLAVAHILLKNLDDLVELHGKATAEAFLRSLGEALTREEGVTLAVGRLSRKRLGVVKDLGSAEQVLGRVAPRIEKLNQATRINGTLVHPEIVAGISVFPADGTSAATLLDRARMALSETQSAPGIHLYRSGAHAEASRRFRIREALSSALDHDELTLYYQPMFSADGRRLIGFEALARWLDGPEGTISPAEFIPIAEESEALARKLTRFVLRQACREATCWGTDSAGRAIKVAVNIAANEFRQIDFIALVQSVLAETGIEPQQLTLELTEQTLIADIDATRRSMHALREMGVGLALDDFGTGYSSLSYLQRLPVQILKVDKSFLTDLRSRSSAREMFRGIVRIARGMGLQVVAEGVEHEKERAILHRLKCDMVQGFLLGRPGDAQSARAWLAYHEAETRRAFP